MMRSRVKMKERVVEVTPPRLVSSLTGSTTDGEDGGQDRSGYESEVDSISDSEEESSDDLDPLVLLSGSRSTNVIQKLATKRSDVFEYGSNSKRLKPPPKQNLSFLKNSNVAQMLKKSESLQEMHKMDKERAIDELANEKNPKDIVLKKLSKSKASKDNDYVGFMTNNQDNVDIKDFYFFGKPKYVKPMNDQLPTELLLLLPMGPIRRDEECYKFDVFNELNIETVYKECLNIRKSEDVEINDVVRFMENIGGDINRDEISRDELSIDPKLVLQNIELILMKFKYLITKVVRNEYSKEKYELIIKTIGLVMMDRRVYNSDGSLLLNEILNDVIEWRDEHKDGIELQGIVKIWLGLTKETKLIIRIIETLKNETSLVISRLKKIISTNVFSGFFAFKQSFIHDEYKFQSELNKSIILKLEQWNAKPKAYYETLDEFYEPKLQFISLIQCLNITYKEGEIKGQLDEIKAQIEKLRSKISMGFSSSEQASFKSLLLLISTLLENGEQII